MPFCYGGGIKNIKQIERIINLGVEKVALSSVLFEDNAIVYEAVNKFGSQSIIAVLDVKKSSIFKKYNIFINNGKKKWCKYIRFRKKNIKYGDRRTCC